MSSDLDSWRALISPFEILGNLTWIFLFWSFFRSKSPLTGANLLHNGSHSFRNLFSLFFFFLELCVSIFRNSENLMWISPIMIFLQAEFDLTSQDLVCLLEIVCVAV